MAKKKGKSGGYKYNYYERKARNINPWFMLVGYFLIFAVISYPLFYFIFDVGLGIEMSGMDLLRSSIGVGIGCAAYFGIIAKQPKY